MTGGDQVRLVQALTNQDGSDTPFLLRCDGCIKEEALLPGQVQEPLHKELTC